MVRNLFPFQLHSKHIFSSSCFLRGKIAIQWKSINFYVCMCSTKYMHSYSIHNICDFLIIFPLHFIYFFRRLATRLLRYAFAKAKEATLYFQHLECVLVEDKYASACKVIEYTFYMHDAYFKTHKFNLNLVLALLVPTHTLFTHSISHIFAIRLLYFFFVYFNRIENILFGSNHVETKNGFSK